MKIIQRNLICAALGATAITAQAQGQGGPGSADSFSYRCRILGDAAACWVLEATLRGDPVPGPYATCLVAKGAGRDEALAAAATLGERPTAPTRGKAQARSALRAGEISATDRN